MRKPHDHENTKKSLLIIQMEKASDNRVGGPPGVNISDGFGGVAAPVSKALALVDNNSSSRGVSWRQFAEKLGIGSASGKRRVYNLMEIIGA